MGGLVGIERTSNEIDCRQRLWEKERGIPAERECSVGTFGAKDQPYSKVRFACVVDRCKEGLCDGCLHLKGKAL